MRSPAPTFIMKPDGKGWLFVPTGLVDGPLPVHYEPLESPVANLLYKRQSSPVLKWWARGAAHNPIAEVGDPRFPCVITTYRLTEHYLSGAMSRWLPHLAELQPSCSSRSARAGAGTRHQESRLRHRHVSAPPHPRPRARHQSHRRDDDRRQAGPSRGHAVALGWQEARRR